MKIMFYTSSMGKGGAERVISVLANELIKDNEVCIVVNTLKNMAYELNQKIKSLELDDQYNNSNIYRNIKRIITTKKIINKEKPDIIISFLPMPSYRILMLKRMLKNIPIIISDRNDPKEEYKTLINKILMTILYKRADGFVFQTKEQKEYFSEKIQEKSIIIPNPIKDEFLEETSEEIEKDKTIITVGRLVEQKNQKMLIKAFHNICDKYKDYKLKIFGDGPLKDELQKYIDTLKMNGKIELCGTSDNIKKELQKAELFILSSNYEGMPNALIEAMAVGLSCISTDCPCGGPRELIENKKNGILIPVNSEKDLILAIEEVLNNKSYSNELGKNAELIKEELNTKKVVTKWNNYILEIKDKKESKK